MGLRLELTADSRPLARALEVVTWLVDAPGTADEFGLDELDRMLRGGRASELVCTRIDAAAAQRGAVRLIIEPAGHLLEVVQRALTVRRSDLAACEIRNFQADQIAQLAAVQAHELELDELRSFGLQLPAQAVASGLPEGEGER